MLNQNFGNMFLVLFLAIVVSINCAFAQRGADQSKSTKQNSQNQSKEEAEETGLIGKWTSSEAKIEFFANGSMTINGEKFNYGVVKNIITIENNDGQMEFPFTLKGNTLTVMVEGRKVVYTRATKNDEPNEDNSGGGSVPQELVGKWCYQSNVTSNDGGRMSNTCFTLNSNGTYQYYSETNSSNPYGGTSSQSSDAGRWSATATTLTSYSNSGQTKTFNLEKRNHPKTGDPMLIVDGGAFVTFYQKQPW